jgi:AraC family transcriptional regulator, transcriptional activator FtrA
MPLSPPARFNPRVVVLAYEGLCSFEFSCAAEVFGLPRPEFGRDWYRFSTCAASRRPLRSQYGLRIAAAGGLELMARAGTIIIPGWTSIDTPVPRALLDALRHAHSRGARLLSICSGAFVLAATGLLDGYRATTHWRYAQQLQARFPQVSVDADVLYVDEGSLLTSAGSAAGLDLCLHLVRRDWGAQIANQVARRLVIPPHREGGQAQYIEQPLPARAQGSLAPLLDAMRRRLHAPQPLAELARQARLSERTLLRRFRAATGTTPAEWLTTARLARARELLEKSTLSMEQIAQQCGFGTAITLRHHFRRKVGASPRAYRERFARQS